MICLITLYPLILYLSVGLHLEKGIKYSKTNYRPIAVLVAFDNVFERILANQLYLYFSDKVSPFLSACASHIGGVRTWPGQATTSIHYGN